MTSSRAIFLAEPKDETHWVAILMTSETGHPTTVFEAAALAFSIVTLIGGHRSGGGSDQPSEGHQKRDSLLFILIGRVMHLKKWERPFRPAALS